tara:strand:- start:3484 stop:3648 length:165 start_codon:yes stop_codon:yes gene_type:complete
MESHLGLMMSLILSYVVKFHTVESVRMGGSSRAVITAKHLPQRYVDAVKFLEDG